MATSTRPAPSETREVKPRPSPSSVAASEARTSQTRSARPGKAFLGRHRHRGRVRRRLLRVGAPEAGPLRIRLLEAAYPDPVDRVVQRDADPLGDEVGTAARDLVRARAAVPDEVVPDARKREARDRDERAEGDQADDRLPAPDDGRRDDHTAPERDVARLGVGQEEAAPGRHHDCEEPDELPARDTAEQDARQRRQDRDGEIAAVDGRIPEHRVDPEEGRVGVADDHAGVPEDVAPHPLIATHDRVCERCARRVPPRAMSASGRATAAARSRC